jgi:TPR repeat protein
MAMYQLGVLAKQAGDLKLAESWWQRAAELGDPDAVQALGESG